MLGMRAWKQDQFKSGYKCPQCGRLVHYLTQYGEVCSNCGTETCKYVPVVMQLRQVGVRGWLFKQPILDWMYVRDLDLSGGE